MKKFDAIVIGKGIAGLGVAVAFACAGKKVLAIGKKGTRGEASIAAAGILDPLLEMQLKSPFLSLTREAFRQYPRLIRKLQNETGNDVSYFRTGMIYLAMSPKEEKLLRERFKWQRKTGIPVVWKNRAWIKKNEPLVSDKVRAGIFYPTVGCVHPRKMMHALHLFAKKRKVVLHEYPESATLAIRNQKVVGVHVGENFFEAPVVVNASGSWAGANRFLGVMPPVVPVRGQILIVKGKGIGISTILHSLDGAYIVPWPQQKFLLGSTVEFVGFNPNVTNPGIESILKRSAAIVPRIRDLRAVESWAGLRPFPSDRLPLIGPTDISGLFMAAGFYRSGILIGCHVGELLVKGILSGKMPRVLFPFDPRRFAGKNKHRRSRSFLGKSRK